MNFYDTSVGGNATAGFASKRAKKSAGAVSHGEECPRTTRARTPPTQTRRIYESSDIETHPSLPSRYRRSDIAYARTQRFTRIVIPSVNVRLKLPSLPSKVIVSLHRAI